jgi:hypothetical protein
VDAPPPHLLEVGALPRIEPGIAGALQPPSAYRVHLGAEAEAEAETEAETETEAGAGAEAEAGCGSLVNVHAPPPGVACDIS